VYGGVSYTLNLYLFVDRSMGNLQQALVCFEKRLVVTHELEDSVHKGSAYGELGCLHSLLGKFTLPVSLPEVSLLAVTMY